MNTTRPIHPVSESIMNRKHPEIIPGLGILCVIAIIWGILLIAPPVRAQTDSTGTPVWETANEIRELAFQAQSELYAADRSDDPILNQQIAADLINQAMERYQMGLQPQFAHLAPAADQAVIQAFALAATAALNGNAPELAAARGRLWTGLLWGSYTAALETLDAGEMNASAGWLRLREYREATKVTTVDDPAVEVFVKVQTGEMSPGEAAIIIGNDLRDTYTYRLRDALAQVEDAGAKGYTTRAAEWAGQAAGYYIILQPDLEEKSGGEIDALLKEAFTALESGAVQADWQAVAAQLDRIDLGLADYQPVEWTEAEIAERGRLLYLFTELIYTEYKDGVRNGEISIPIEYQEAVTFHDQAEAVFQEMRPAIAAQDPEAVDRLAEILNETDILISGLGERAAVEVLVDEALTIIENDLGIRANAGDSAAAFTILDTLLNDIVSTASDGRYEDAERTRLEAYAVFENGPEQRLAHRAPVLSRELEGLFWEGSEGQPGLAILLSGNAPAAEVQAVVEKIQSRLDEAEGFLSTGLSGTLAVINSAAIIFREGLEAVLIIGAILGYLRATNEPRKYSAWVYAGVIAAILLSLATWWAANSLITISAASRELIEGVASLMAVAVLFYVTNWLFHKAYVVDWMTFVKEQVGKALTRGSALALAGLGFTVVYREGFETVLFYQALLFDAEAGSVALGFILGSLVILALAFVILRMSKRIPLQPLFAVTGLLLLLLAFNFTGAGIRELQEASTVPVTLLPWMPENLVLMEIFGIFPTVETTLAQVVFLLAVAGTFGYSRWQGQKKPKGGDAPNRSQKQPTP